MDEEQEFLRAMTVNLALTIFQNVINDDEVSGANKLRLTMVQGVMVKMAKDLDIPGVDGPNLGDVEKAANELLHNFMGKEKFN